MVHHFWDVSRIIAKPEKADFHSFKKWAGGRKNVDDVLHMGVGTTASNCWQILVQKATRGKVKSFLMCVWSVSQSECCNCVGEWEEAWPNTLTKWMFKTNKLSSVSLFVFISYRKSFVKNEVRVFQICSSNQPFLQLQTDWPLTLATTIKMYSSKVSAATSPQNGYENPQLAKESLIKYIRACPCIWDISCSNSNGNIWKLL